MRALLINHTTPTCGIGRYASTLYRSFLAKQVTMLDLSSGSPDMAVWRKNPTKVVLRAFSMMKRALKIPQNFDVYHFTSELLSPMCLNAGPSVITFWYDPPDPVPTYLLSYKVETRLARNANAVICTAETHRKALIPRLGLKPSRTRTIYPGVDHMLFRERDRSACRKILGLPDDKRLILSIATATKRKNIPSLLNAFKTIVDEEPETRLVLLGGINQECNTLEKRLGITQNIVRMGRLSDEQLAYVYNACDVLLHTSKHEGFGMPLVEAMASGLPVVASNGPAIPEILDGAGVKVGTFDVESYASEVLRILSSKDHANDLAQRGIERSMCFDWTKCAEQTFKVYEDITAIS